jgi:two-component system, chemotaxis family, sensor kinase CheA
MAIDIRKFLVRFVEEARDHINKLNEGLAALADGSADAACVDALFRSVHTIKGSSRMLKLATITETAHKFEDVMGALREGSLHYEPSLGNLLFRATDALSALVDKLAETLDGDVLPPPDASLCQALIQAVGKSEAEGPRSESSSAGPGTGTAAPPTPSAPAAPVVPAPCADVASEAGSPPRATPSSSAPGAGPAVDARLNVSETVRVRLAKLDELIKLMGEVVSSHASMGQRLEEIRHLDRDLREHLPETEAARLHHFVLALKDDVQAQETLKNELHDKTLVMRMLPLAIIFEPAARLVRELARTLGKQVECTVKGASIELDRQMIDKLSDPITHLIRNSLDHGLEPAQRRLAAGKPAQGRLALSARQDGGFVVIDVADDGGGIALDAVREKAVKKGIVSPARAEGLSDQDVLDLIFLPGFSTKSSVNDMSGRGVGMDVVKQSVIGDLRGSISVETISGVGTTFSLRLPLSLAIMRVVLVAADGLPFAITAQYVEALLRLPREALLDVTERQVVVIQNEFVPVVPLARLLGIPAQAASRPHAGAARRDSLLLLVLRVRQAKIAVQVDSLLDERDMVIKPLPGHMGKLPLLSGIVTTGKNELVSVLHAPQLLDLARRIGVREDGGAVEVRERQRQYTILVVDDSMSTREIEKDILEAYGYMVTLAQDGVDGLHKAINGDYDAVLTDVEMPHMDGFTLTSRLRQEERYRHRPIVIITSRENEEDKRRGLQVGADAYIVKGDFAQGNLVNTLRTLLG